MVPRLREFFRQGQAEVVSSSNNKILATWEPFFLPDPVLAAKLAGQWLTKCKSEGEEELWFSFHLGKSCKNLMIKEEVWFGLSWEKLVKNELVLNHAPPQVYRAISLLLAFGRCNTQP